jgi:site-specific DNA-methyltransferase (adenine-specific)
MEQHLLLGDSKDVLKTIKDGSIDLLATDPPYSIGFLGKSWDKVLPDKEIWKQCYRVLKPGAFIAVMSSPRSDVLYRMIKDLEDAGFDMSFSPILWTYHTGFPKASDTSKMIDKRGVDLGDKYEGSKLGFQPKPAVEHIIIGMKPHGQKSYIDNVLNFEALPDNIKMTYPFIQVPKPAKKEKDFGLKDDRELKKVGDGRITENDTAYQRGKTERKNIHPTTKPVKLMSYIITLFTREGDWVLDPFLGSGTTGIASKLINRNFIGIEREKEYMDIAEERLSVPRETLIKFFKMEKDTQTKFDL